MLLAATPAATAGAAAQDKGARSVRPLANGWRFVQDDALTDEAGLAATGDSWQAVTLPHTWNASDAASTNATVPYKRGRGWYRLVFDAPKEGARHWLEPLGGLLVHDDGDVELVGPLRAAPRLRVRLPRRPAHLEVAA